IYNQNINYYNINKILLNKPDLKFNNNSKQYLLLQSIISSIQGSIYSCLLQTNDGFWGSDYGGPLFLLPGFIISCYICNIDIGIDRKNEIIKYILNHQQIDGGWGTHIESISTSFGTILNYI